MILFYFFIVAIINSLIMFFPGLNKELFLASSILFSIVLLLDVIHNMQSKKTWFDPYALLVLKNFFLGYGIIAYISLVGNLDEFAFPYELLNKAMIYINLAYFTIYIISNNKIFDPTIKTIISKSNKYIRSGVKLNWFWIFTIYFLSVAIRFILINEGVFGYLSTIKQETSSLPGFITSLSSLGRIILFIVLLNYFKNKNKKYFTILVFILEFIFALIAGFKGGIVIIFIFVFLAMYLDKKKIKWYLIAFGVISISFSYSFVEPYREFLQANTSVSTVSEYSMGIVSVINNYEKSSNIDDENVVKDVFSRFGYLNEFLRMVNYKTNHKEDASTPDFGMRFWQAPLITIIPRFIWPNKPTNDLGVTFITWKVQNNPTVISSSAFGPIGSLYFGGAFYVVAGLIIIAFITKFSSFCLQKRKIGFWIIGLAAFQSCFSLEQEFSFVFASTIQTILLAFVGQLIIFKNDEYHIFPQK